MVSKPSSQFLYRAAVILLLLVIAATISLSNIGRYQIITSNEWIYAVDTSTGQVKVVGLGPSMQAGGKFDNQLGIPFHKMKVTIFPN